MTRDLIDPFTAAIADSLQRLTALSDSGRKMIGYFCTYTPVEIIHAAGFIPIRITGGSGHADKAAGHVPEFICPYMKMSLEKALNSRYDFLSGVVQGYSCDAACGMVNIWKDVFKKKMFHALPIPYNDSSESRTYYASALDELVGKLNAIGGEFNENKLNASLQTYHQIRSLLLKLYERRYEKSLPVSSSALMTIIDSGFILPPEDYLKMLNDFVDTLPKDVSPRDSGCPVLITGSLIEDPGICDIIESCGGRIVADDLCNGFRQISPASGQGNMPMDRLIDRYVNRFPCPARSRATHRIRKILELLARSGAKGVIFVLQKFCTPHLADYPMLSNTLKDKEVPSLLIEMDETWQMQGQLKTRLESFFEMLEV